MVIHSKWTTNSLPNDEINSELRSANKSAESHHQKFALKQQALQHPAQKEHLIELLEIIQTIMFLMILSRAPNSPKFLYCFTNKDLYLNLRINLSQFEFLRRIKSWTNKRIRNCIRRPNNISTLAIPEMHWSYWIFILLKINKILRWRKNNGIYFLHLLANT